MMSSLRALHGGGGQFARVWVGRKCVAVHQGARSPYLLAFEGLLPGVPGVAEQMDARAKFFCTQVRTLKQTAYISALCACE